MSYIAAGGFVRMSGAGMDAQIGQSVLVSGYHQHMLVNYHKIIKKYIAKEAMMIWITIYLILGLNI